MSLLTVFSASPFHISGSLYYHNNLYGQSTNDGNYVPITNAYLTDNDGEFLLDNDGVQLTDNVP